MRACGINVKYSDPSKNCDMCTFYITGTFEAPVWYGSLNSLMIHVHEVDNCF